MEHFEDVNVGETNRISSLETKKGLVLQIEKYKWWVMLPDAPYYDGYNTLENTSEEIHSNRPYPSFGIWLYDFNFKIYRTHFDSVFFIIMI